MVLGALGCINNEDLKKILNDNIMLIPWLMEPRGSMLHSQGLPSNPYPSRINPIPHIDTYFFKIQSNIILPSTPRPS